MELIKSFLFVITTPVIIVLCFSQNQINIKPNHRMPAVVSVNK